MSGTISFLLKNARIALDVTDIVQQAWKEDKSMEEKVNIAAKSLFTFFESASFLGYYGEAGLKYPKLTLAGELGSRMALSITDPVKEMLNGKQPFNLMMENLASITKMAGEMQILQEQQYLALPEDEFARTQRPIHTCDMEGNCEVIGYKPLDRQECEKIIAQMSTVGKIAESVEILSKNVIINTAIGTFENFCKFFREHRIAQLIQQNAAIPEAYYDDPVFEVTAFQSCLQMLQIHLGRRYKEVISTHRGVA